MPTAVFACKSSFCLVNLGSLYLTVRLSILRGHSLLLPPLIEEFLIFQPVQLFTCEDRLQLPTSLHMKPKLPNFSDFKFSFNMGEAWAHMASKHIYINIVGKNDTAGMKFPRTLIFLPPTTSHYEVFFFFFFFFDQKIKYHYIACYVQTIFTYFWIIIYYI